MQMLFRTGRKGGVGKGLFTGYDFCLRSPNVTFVTCAACVMEKLYTTFIIYKVRLLLTSIACDLLKSQVGYESCRLNHTSTTVVHMTKNVVAF